MDLYKQSGAKVIGPGGIRCKCCDWGYCRKRKSKRGKHAFSQLRRTILKRFTKKLIEDELKRS